MEIPSVTGTGWESGLGLDEGVRDPSWRPRLGECLKAQPLRGSEECHVGVGAQRWPREAPVEKQAWLQEPGREDPSLVA